MGVSLKNDNRGLSLVEVMVVVAIMAVVGAVGIMGINAMSGKPAQRTSQQIIYSLEKHRTSSMGKVNAKYEICMDGDQVVAKEYLTNEDSFGGPTNVYKLGDKTVKVSYWCEGDTAATSINDGNTLTLQFDRSTGAFKKQIGKDVYCTKITVQRGGRTYDITLVPLTGKVYTAK